MTQRRLLELEKSFRQITDLILTHPIETVASEIVETLGNALDCDWGTYWKVDPALQRLRPIATWSRSSFKAPELDTDTKNRTLSLSEGTAGHVWRSRKPIWTLDLTKDMCLPRSLDAENAGLHGGVWFAIKSNLAVYGVLELLGKNLITPSEELLAGVERFGLSIGEIFEKSAR